MNSVWVKINIKEQERKRQTLLANYRLGNISYDEYQRLLCDYHPIKIRVNNTCEKCGKPLD